MGTSDKISYMNSSQVLYCNGVAKISVLGGHSAKSTHQSVAGVVTRERLMQQRACVARAHGARGARCVFLQRSFACSGRPLSRCIATAFVARSLISESAQHELQHLAFIARVRNSLCISLSLPAISLTLPVLCISLCISLGVSLCVSLCVFLCVSLSAPLSLRLSPPRTLSFCFSPDRRVCHHLSLRLSLSSFRPRLHWRSRQKSTTTPAVSACDVQRLPAYLSRFNTCW